MATSPLRTALNLELAGRGLTNSSGVVTAALNQSQIEELCDVVTARGCKIALPAPATPDVFVVAPIASQTNTITITGNAMGHNSAFTLEIADAAGDTLAVTVTSGAVKISLANTTDSKNTLTLVKAALDAALTSTTGALYSTFITGTASTQLVHGGTNTRAASAAGVTAGTGVKSSTAGTGNLAAAGPLTITPV